MITVRLKIKSYDKSKNIFWAELLNGDLVAFDPFLNCAMDFTDEDFEDYYSGNGDNFVGREYLLKEYTVYKDLVAPCKNGMVQL